MVRSMWLFKHKFHADGTLSRYKAHLVTNGSSQQLGVDFEETFSLVVKPATIFTVLNLAMSRKWPIYQLDVKNAFLNGDLSETVYMNQLPGFVDARFPNHKKYALDLLARAHMGTLEHGLHLYASVTTFLVGYTDADWAGCPSTCRCTSGYYMFLGDNLLSWSAKRQHIISRSSAEAKYQGVANVVAETTWLHNLLCELHSSLFTATLVYCTFTFSPVFKPATIRTVLSLVVSRKWMIYQLDVKNAFINGDLSETVYMHQLPGFVDKKYALDLLARAHMVNCNLSRTPVDSETKLGPDGVPIQDPTLYRSLAERGVYYLTFTRPDLSYAFQQVCLYMQDLKEPHFAALKRILRYVQGTLELGLHLYASATTSLVEYIDADWTGVNMVRSMWLFKHKFYADGTLSRYKAHLVANGSSQQLGVDFDDTFSSVVKPATIRTVLSLAMTRKWLIHQLYVKNAFLNGDLSETKKYALDLLARAHMQVCLYMHDTREPYFAALKRILRYIHGTLDLGLHLYASITTSLVGYTDADWAGCSSTRRSTSGYYVFLGDNLLSWCVKRQHIIPRFSAEAEYQGVANVVAETAWLRNLLYIIKSIDRLPLNTFLISPIPKNPPDALKDPQWRNALYNEYNALVKNGTWLLVPSPAGVNMVRSMWLFKNKFHADGTLSHYKAHLVANGSSQHLGVDFDEILSPVVKPATIHTVLSLAVSHKWPIHQLDVKNAFLNGDLSETVYMHQLPGFVDKKYALDLLARSHMVNCNMSRTPVDFETKLGPNGVPGTLEPALHLYAFATTALVRYTDANWAGCPSTHSAEAEYRGVANVVAETALFRNLLCELQSPLFTATLVDCDNVSAVYMCANPFQHQRTKHNEIDILFVRIMIS
nr:ribonuclease H-like domain-containing protein [Tanacetum cinerariifolium]